MTVRNRVAVARGRERRAEIQRVWDQLLDKSTRYESFTAKDIKWRLPFPISRQAVSWHMTAIRDEARRSASYVGAAPIHSPASARHDGPIAAPDIAAADIEGS